MASNLQRPSASPLGAAPAAVPRRSVRTILQACAVAQPEFSGTAFRVLLALALLLLGDCYMLKLWLAVPLGDAMVAAVPSSMDIGLSGLVLMAPPDAPVTPVDSDAVVKGLAFGLGLLAAIGSSMVFIADGMLRGGALLHRIAVRHAVRRLTNGRRPTP